MKRYLLRSACLALYAVLSCAASWAQFTSSVVTGSRSLSTAYQNTSGKPMLVIVTPESTGAGGGSNVTAQFLTDAANPPITQTSANFSGISPNSSLATNLFAIVCPSNYFKVTATAPGTPSIGIWVETTIDDVGSTCTQNVVTGSRAIPTVYQNSSLTQTIWVSVTCNSSAGDTCTAYTDSAATPTTRVIYNGCQAGSHNCALFFPVLPQYYYKITRGGDATLTSWIETTTLTPPRMAQSSPIRSVGILGTFTTYAAGASAIFATISATNSSISTGSLFALTDAANPTTVLTDIQSGIPSRAQCVATAVPAAWFYAAEADISGDTDVVWEEWTIPNTSRRVQHRSYFVDQY